MVGPARQRRALPVRYRDAGRAGRIACDNRGYACAHRRSAAQCAGRGGRIAGPVDRRVGAIRARCGRRRGGDPAAGLYADRAEPAHARTLPREPADGLGMARLRPAAAGRLRLADGGGRWRTAARHRLRYPAARLSGRPAGLHGRFRAAGRGCRNLLATDRRRAGRGARARRYPAVRLGDAADIARRLHPPATTRRRHNDPVRRCRLSAYAGPGRGGER